MNLNTNQLDKLWYSNNEHGMIGIPFTKEVEDYCTQIFSKGVQMLSFENYWVRYAQFMLSGSKQVYFGWQNNSYWLIESTEIDNDNFFVDGKYGYHLIEMRTDGVGYIWVPSVEDEESELSDAHYSLLFYAWDEFMEGGGEPLSPIVTELISNNVATSERIHEKLQETHPPGKFWSNKQRDNLSYPWAES
jgi:hypothetical protein